MTSDPDPPRPARAGRRAATKRVPGSGRQAPASRLRAPGLVVSVKVRARKPPKFRLQVDVCDRDGLPVRAPGLARWLIDVSPAAARGTVTVVLTSDSRMRVLNRSYRGADYATDVLSFPSVGPEASQAPRGERTPTSERSRGGPRKPVRPQARSPEPGASSPKSGARGLKRTARPHLGDIVIARGIAARQARAAGHALSTELRVLALHGLLHLLGYDHERDEGKMARVERRLRRRGGLGEGLIERAV
jgi:probable rRNA maturation factor